MTLWKKSRKAKKAEITETLSGNELGAEGVDESDLLILEGQIIPRWQNAKLARACTRYPPV